MAEPPPGTIKPEDILLIRESASIPPGMAILDSYDCTKSGCPGNAELMVRCSCRTHCGAPGCRGYALEEDMPWRGGGEEPGE